MLKLNASFSKKVPGDEDFSSRGYSASVELELSDSLEPGVLKSRISETFALVRDSVENEISGKSLKRISSSNHSENKGRRKTASASPKQIRYLCDLARRNHISLDGCLETYGAVSAEDLSRRDCSSLIDDIRSQAA